MPRSPNDTKPSELLTAAAAYVEEHGWMQGSGQGEHGEVCALMAVRMTALGKLRSNAMTSAKAVHALEEVAQELQSLPVSVPMFNDSACRSRADVMAWIEKARAQLEEQGQ